MIDHADQAVHAAVAVSVRLTFASRLVECLYEDGLDSSCGAGRWGGCLSCGMVVHPSADIALYGYLLRIAECC
jgi:hypothetical protein